jgi:hypothetical protein
MVDEIIAIYALADDLLKYVLKRLQSRKIPES